jgi:hypothetical protein
MFGPNFERYDDIQASEKVEEEGEKEIPSTLEKDKTKAKKGKIVAKSTGLKYQFQILESIGVPRSEIKKFADPLHWLTYFPPIAIVSLSLPLLFRSSPFPSRPPQPQTLLRPYQEVSTNAQSACRESHSKRLESVFSVKRSCDW